MSRLFAAVEATQYRYLEVGDKVWTAEYGFRRITAIDIKRHFVVLRYKGIVQSVKMPRGLKVLRALVIHTIPDVAA